MPGTLRLLAAFIAACTSCMAQPSRLQVMAGAGIGFVTAHSLNATYIPVRLPLAAARYAFPLHKHVAFITGLSYGQKGFDSRSEFRSGIDDDLDVYQGRTRYQFLSIPLQVSLQLRQRRHCILWLDAGMSYGFMMRARADLDVYSYRHGRLINHNVYTSRPPIGLLPRDSRIPPAVPCHPASLNLFNPAVTASLILACRRRYILRAFYEYHLYDASSEPGSGSLHLHAAGLMAGLGW